MTLRDLTEFEVQTRLLAVPGVAAVERLGGYLRQLQVQLDPDRMVARGISLEEVLHALEGANVNASGGLVRQGPMEWGVRAVGRAQSAADIGAVVVALRGSTPVLLAELADVREAPAVRRGIAHRLDGEIVSCRVVKQFGADTVQVAAAVRAALDEIRRGLPPGVSLRIAYDQAELVSASLGGVGRAVSIGALFVVLVLFLLLGDVRAALIITLTIPLSVAIAGLLLRQAGVGLNTMTLGGLAIAVGLLVDASIIVVENVVHRIAGATAPAARAQTAIAAEIEVARPITFAAAIVIAVFLPLFSRSGIEGRMYGPLAAAVIASMLAALVLAVTITPIAAAFFLRAPPPGKEPQVWLLRQVERLYRPALAGCLRRSGLVRILALGVTVPAVLLGLSIGTDFIRSLLIDGHDGTRIPLSQLAKIEQPTAPGAIRREGGSRRVAVEAGVSGRDLGGVASELRESLARELELPTGYFVDVGGRVESQARATRALTRAIGVAIVLVFLLLYLALGSVLDTAVILATLPDAFVGGILALWILGLLPLLLLDLHGTEIERPLAIVMIGGLLTSTLFTLLALPTFYSFVHHWRERRSRATPPR